ncbi:MAG: cytochrome c biogenesis protein CcdA [Eubacteriales bacterium]
MAYLLTFLEGIITFISPCLLPMLPIYISYFAGGEAENKKPGALVGAIGFVLGFTIVFISLGAFAGTLGKALIEYSRIVNLIAGIIVMLFGFSFLGFIRLPFLGMGASKVKAPVGFFSAIVFGIVFSISWTPCIGTFLGSALMLAASSGQSMAGILMLLTFSAGLGIPFIMSAVLIEKLKGAFDWIKKHYKSINLVCGILLVAVGILMATGLMGYYLSFLSF